MKRSYKNPALCCNTRREEEQSGCQAAIVLHNVIRNLPRSQYFRDLFYRILTGAIWLYIILACGWTICYLVNEIFEKLGVA